MESDRLNLYFCERFSSHEQGRQWPSWSPALFCAVLFLNPGGTLHLPAKASDVCKHPREDTREGSSQLGGAACCSSAPGSLGNADCRSLQAAPSGHWARTGLCRLRRDCAGPSPCAGLSRAPGSSVLSNGDRYKRAGRLGMPERLRHAGWGADPNQNGEQIIDLQCTSLPSLPHPLPPPSPLLIELKQSVGLSWL